MCIRDRVDRGGEIGDVVGQEGVAARRGPGEEPVSYTHLDVYKRQGVHGSRESKGYEAAITALATATVPVSYTHLDVYKRQE